MMKRKQVPKEKIEIKRQQYVGENVAEIEKMSKLTEIEKIDLC
jgi:lipoate-protein ligase A